MMNSTNTETRTLRFEVPDREQLERLMVEPLPAGLRQTGRDLDFFRDIYFDLEGGDLARKGASVRLRIHQDGSRTLTVDVREREGEDGVIVRRQVEAHVEETDAAEVFAGSSEPARVLRALLDPARLQPVFEIETLRRTRSGELAGEDAEVEFLYDVLTVRQEDLAGDFQEIELRLPNLPDSRLERLVRTFDEEYGLRPTLSSTAMRAHEVLELLGVEALEHTVRTARRVAVTAYAGGRIALMVEGSSLQLPSGPGSGPDACRRVLRAVFGRGDGRIRLLGTSPGLGGNPAVEVWLAEGVPTEIEAGPVWLPLDETLGMVGTSPLRDFVTLAGLQVTARSGLAGTPSELTTAPEEEPWVSLRRAAAPSPWEELADLIELSLPSKKEVPSIHLLNMELSRIAFDERVLALAEDERVPLLERVRFLSIFGSRQDDFFMTRVAGFKNQIHAGSTKRTLDGLTPAEQLAVIGVRARRAVGRAYGILCDVLLPELERHGIEIVPWDELSDDERSFLAANYSDGVDALLTPLAADPSHPFPHVRNLRPAVAAVLKLPGSRDEHFAAIELPGELPRFVPFPGGRRFVPLEEVILGRLPELYAGFEVIAAHTFRVTRNANISLDSDDPQDVLSAVEAEVAQRPFRRVVRLEVEASMPESMREMLLREFQYEGEDGPATLSEDDVYVAEWLVDLAALAEIAGLDMSGLRYPPLERNDPLEHGRSVVDQVGERDRLVRFPYDSFEDTVARFLEEAAEDDAVVSVKTTVYRTDESSPVIQALRRARDRGKEVVVLVELKASFDERRNIQWARSLESAGIHVVFTPPRYKVHAKIALVTRGAGGAVSRYAYIGTGNLNAATAGAYVDVGLFTADAGITEEINGVFNLLIGYSGRTQYEHLLVAPFTMHQRLADMIEREAERARAGQGGVIRGQLNGLSDRRLIGALYRASRAGVRVELAAREICSLRPGVPGLSENIRVVSLLGRFLQHARIFQFGHGEEAEYFIGSSDWRPRNLIRRVEVITPVRDPEHRRTLHGVLDEVLYSPEAWELQPDGSWRRGEQVVGASWPAPGR